MAVTPIMCCEHAVPVRLAIPAHVINVAKGITASFAGLHDVRILSRNGIETRVPDSEDNSYIGGNLSSGAYGYTARDAYDKVQHGKLVVIR